MDDYDYLRGSDGTGHAVVAHITADRSIGATVIEVDSLDNWQTNDFIVTTGTQLPSGFLDPDTITEMRAHITGGDIIIDSFEPGSVDDGNTDGQIAVIKPTTGFANGVAEALNGFGDHLARGGLYHQTVNITASGVYEKPANLKFVIVEMVGGGGGGGGAGATGASASAGGGGGAGEYSRKKILAADLLASETVTIGAAGSAAANAAGGDGGTTSFGAHVTAVGGGGGPIRTATANQQGTNGGAGGTGGTGGDLHIRGGDGGPISINSTSRGFSGHGGMSRFSGMTGSEVQGSTTGKSAGTAGRPYGGGGSGAYNSQSQTSTSGGAGSLGLVLVHEYF